MSGIKRISFAEMENLSTKWSLKTFDKCVKLYKQSPESIKNVKSTLENGDSLEKVFVDGKLINEVVREGGKEHGVISYQTVYDKDTNNLLYKFQKTADGDILEWYHPNGNGQLVQRNTEKKDHQGILEILSEKTGEMLKFLYDTTYPPRK